MLLSRKFPMTGRIVGTSHKTLFDLDLRFRIINGQVLLAWFHWLWGHWANPMHVVGDNSFTNEMSQIVSSCADRTTLLRIPHLDGKTWKQNDNPSICWAWSLARPTQRHCNLKLFGRQALRCWPFDCLNDDCWPAIPVIVSCVHVRALGLGGTRHGKVIWLAFWMGALALACNPWALANSPGWGGNLEATNMWPGSRRKRRHLPMRVPIKVGFATTRKHRTSLSCVTSTSSFSAYSYAKWHQCKGPCLQKNLPHCPLQRGINDNIIMLGLHGATILWMQQLSTQLLPPNLASLHCNSNDALVQLVPCHLFFSEWLCVAGVPFPVDVLQPMALGLPKAASLSSLEDSQKQMTSSVSNTWMQASKEITHTYMYRTQPINNEAEHQNM